MSLDESARVPSLRIGQLAELAGTTTRAIRHYHSVGLLGEPSRDASGYRRYGPEHFIVLVRIRRLRALGMPLEQIATHLSSASGDPGDLRASLRFLAADIGRQIEDLQALRERVLALAATEVAAPPEAWEAALRTHGLLGDTGTLPADERPAVELLDALHPDGIQGLIAQSSNLLRDPTLARRLKPLLDRFRTLPDDESAIDDLAHEVAPLFPRPENAPPPPIDVERMDELLGDRFSPAQRLFLQRLRQLLEAGESG